MVVQMEKFNLIFSNILFCHVFVQRTMKTIVFIASPGMCSTKLVYSVYVYPGYKNMGEYNKILFRKKV